MAGGLKVNTGVEEASDWGYPHPVAKETLTVTLGEGIIPRTNNSERRACLSFPTSTSLIKPHLRGLNKPFAIRAVGIRTNDGASNQAFPQVHREDSQIEQIAS